MYDVPGCQPVAPEALMSESGLHQVMGVRGAAESSTAICRRTTLVENSRLTDRLSCGKQVGSCPPASEETQ